MNRTDLVDVELKSGSVFRSFLNRNIGEGDVYGNRYGVRILNGGEPVDMTGAACVGYFIRADGVTLVIAGETGDSMASVLLPPACYAVEGSFTLAIKVSGTGFSGTMRIIDGTVCNVTTGQINDPSSEIPDPADYEAKVARAEAAATAMNNLQITATQISGTRYKLAVTRQT